MRVTLIVDDNRVYVDGVNYVVDCSALAVGGLHAVQWDGSRGHEEWKGAGNKPLASIAPYKSYLDAWKVEDDKVKKAAKVREDEIADRRQAEEATKRRNEAWSRLPIDVQRKLLEAKAEEQEKQKQDAWNKLSIDDRSQLIIDAGF